jgi:hypothetical protein
MTDRTKSALLIGGTLVIGMILGGLFNAALVNRRFDEVARLGSPRGLAFRIEEVIQPESEEQAEAIRAVVDEAAPKFMEVFVDSRERMRMLVDSIMAELEPLLTEEQLQRLRSDMRMRSEAPPFMRGPGFGPRDGPPPGEPGERRGRRRPPPGSGVPPGESPPPDTAPGQ